MTIRWTGPWDDTALPAGPPSQRIVGWSENTTGAGTLKNRYRDGDALSAFAWREMYGNANYQYAQSRRTLWNDEFVEKTAGNIDPTKLHTSASWTSLTAIYAVTPPIPLTPNALRGDLAPPQLKVKIRARRSAGAAAGIKVRVYAASSIPQAVHAWAAYAAAAPAGEYVEWSMTANTYPASPGWQDEKTITAPGYSLNTYAFPAAAALPDITVMETVIVIAGYGDGAGNGPYVAAIQVREEAPGA